jgi:DNA-binding MarR family transcriptional regulator
MTDEDVDSAHIAVELGLAMTRLRARLRLESGMSATGWSISQVSTLARVIKKGPLTASAIAQAEHVRPQSVAETLTALRADGLITSEQDPADGRKTLISATAKGKQLVQSVSASREAWLAKAIEAVVDPAERRALSTAISLLNRLTDCDLRTEAPGQWRG